MPWATEENNLDSRSLAHIAKSRLIAHVYSCKQLNSGTGLWFIKSMPGGDHCTCENLVNRNAQFTKS